jgi:hypothetical protein
VEPILATAVIPRSGQAESRLGGRGELNASIASMMGRVDQGHRPRTQEPYAFPVYRLCEDGVEVVSIHTNTNYSPSQAKLLDVLERKGEHQP